MGILEGAPKFWTSKTSARMRSGLIWLNDSPRAMGVVGQHSSIEQPEDAEDPCASLSHNPKEASKKGLFLNDEPSSNVAAFEVFVDS